MFQTKLCLLALAVAAVGVILANPDKSLQKNLQSGHVKLGESLRGLSAPSSFRSKRDTEGVDELFRPSLRFQEVVPPEKIRPALYSSLRLDCQAAGTPQPTIHWLRNGRRVSQSREDNAVTEALFENRSGGSGGVAKLALSSTMSTLYLDCLTSDDAADYTCVAENSYGRISTNTKVDVQGRWSLPEKADLPEQMEADSEFSSASSSACKLMKKRSWNLPVLSPARLYMWTSNMLELEGATVTLFCRGTGLPRPRFTWTGIDGDIIVNSDKYKILPTGDLKIRDITFLENMGLYTCSAENELGTSVAQTFLYPTTVQESLL